jgi:3-phytase
MKTHNIKIILLGISLIYFGIACHQESGIQIPIIKPRIITQPVEYDSDDPAIWINKKDPSKSLVIGTDKHEDGALFVFDLEGKIDSSRMVSNLKRPNNVDVEYGFSLNDSLIDIAVTTERLANKIRVFSLPDMNPIDNGGIEVFAGEELRLPMGIALYKKVTDGSIYAIISRKSGPKDGYLWQYLLEDDGIGSIKATLIRKFGAFSGLKEIESIAVDDELGYVYYSDENFGIRKHHADPDAKNASNELAVFGQNDFMADSEGISIYKSSDTTGYILISDQDANQMNIYRREGEQGAPHQHTLLTRVRVSTNNSDGSEITAVTLNGTFPQGLFVAMSDDRTYHYYDWRDIANLLDKNNQ